jgi:predicted nucleic acid-binding Zn ribbon protein
MSDREELREEFDRTRDVEVARDYMAKLEEDHREGVVGFEAYAYEAIRILPYVIQSDYKAQLDKMREVLNMERRTRKRLWMLVHIQTVSIALLLIGALL